MRWPRPGLVLLLFARASRVQRKRALLTIAAIAWGSLSLMLMLSFGEGLKRSLWRASRGMGHNLAVINDSDAICISRLVHIMGCQEDGYVLSGPQVSNISPDMVAGMWIKANGGLVKEKHLGVM